MREPFLDGITVVELSNGLDAAYCCRLLADWGAEVVKVEPPGGDPRRVKDAALFKRLNAGKKSITLDAASEAGMSLLRAIASYVEVLVADGGAGFKYESLRVDSGRLVVTSVRPSADSRSPSIDLPPGWEFVTGLNAFDATLAALIGVTMTEQGQHVVIAADECLAGAALLTGQPVAALRAMPDAAALFRVPDLTASRSVASLGEHNSEIYVEMLGLGQEELSTLREKGVV